MTSITRPLDWIERHAGVFILAGLIGLGSLGGVVYGQQEQLGSQQSALGRDISNNCAILHFAIDTSRESQAASIKESKKLLPKINFPGLSHKQLVKLTSEKAAGERVYLQRFTKLAEHACRG